MRKLPAVLAALAVMLVVGTVACEGPTITMVGTPERFDPADHGWDARFRAMYAHVEDCIGVRGDYDRLVFYWVDEILRDGDVRGGKWEPPHRIYITEGGFTHRLVRHEMLHDLLRPGDHDDPRFKACAQDP